MKLLRFVSSSSSVLFCLASVAPSTGVAQIGGFVGDMINRAPPAVRQIIPPAAVLVPQAVLPLIIAPSVDAGNLGRAIGDGVSLGQTGRDRDEERARQERDRAAQAAAAAAAARETSKQNLDSRIADKNSELSRYALLESNTFTIGTIGSDVRTALNEEARRRAQGANALTLSEQQVRQLQIDLEIVVAAIRPGEGADEGARITATHSAARRLVEAARQRGTSVQEFVSNAARSIGDGDVSFGNLLANANALEARLNSVRDLINQQIVSATAERDSLVAQRAALN